jgi:O-antigen/teichoic acid export membrane protein
MTRTRKAAVLAGFTYVQYALSIVTGIVLVPLILKYLGARPYGLWLTTGELLAYASMIELGVLGVLPWMLAEADGMENRTAMRRLVSSGLAVGCIVGLGFAVVSIVLWQLLPSALRLDGADRAMIVGPLGIIVASTAVTYPLRVYRAVLAGLQDVTVNGAIGIVEASITAVVTIAMLLKGGGIYSLACASAAASIVGTSLGAARAAWIAPDLFWQWKRPTIPELRVLLGHGIGTWFGSFGWQIIAASNSIVITYLGHPEWVPVYACTTKLCGLLMQLGWVVPDSGLIGLAQLHGAEPRSERLASRIVALLHVHLLLAGASACMLLAFNPAFVTRWVGPTFFAGLPVNGILAAVIVSMSLVHGCQTISSVLGRRMAVGIVTLVNAAVQVVAAIVLGRRFGLSGVAAASVVSAWGTSMPAGIILLRSVTTVTVRGFNEDAIKPWLRRFAPLVVIASAVGVMSMWLGVWFAACSAAAIGSAYLWQMRALYQILPLDPRWARWLVSLRLLPAIPRAVPVEPS